MDENIFPNQIVDVPRTEKFQFSDVLFGYENTIEMSLVRTVYRCIPSALIRQFGARVLATCDICRSRIVCQLTSYSYATRLRTKSHTRNCFKQAKMHSCAQKINKYGENGTRDNYPYTPSSRLASTLNFFISFNLIL